MRNGTAGADLDLGAASAPPRRIRLPADAITTLGIGELLEVARQVGRPYTELGDTLRGGGNDAILTAVAIAYVLARRLEPDVTWEAAQTWRIELVGDVDPTVPGPTMPQS